MQQSFCAANLHVTVVVLHFKVEVDLMSLEPPAGVGSASVLVKDSVDVAYPESGMLQQKSSFASLGLHFRLVYAFELHTTGVRRRAKSAIEFFLTDCHVDPLLAVAAIPPLNDAPPPGVLSTFVFTAY